MVKYTLIFARANFFEQWNITRVLSGKMKMNAQAMGSLPDLEKHITHIILSMMGPKTKVQ